MIGQLRSVVLDTKDPRKLAEFYAELLGGTVRDEEDGTWVVVETPGAHRLAFQLSPDHEPPKFPDTHGSQQIHLDIRVTDPDKAEQEALGLGATRIKDVPGEDNFRVFRDPAGHTFCLVYGISEEPADPTGGSGA